MSEIEHEVSSGNVFADIGMAEPVESLAKAELARKVGSIIKHRHLNQTEAAKLLGIDQPKVSRLLRGQLKEFSMTKLLDFMLRLDRDIEIRIKKHRSGHAPPGIEVLTL
ncbi:MAG: helix-turn-helix transcriptional regulator [Pseudomonadota bacterium]|nr:helix-turn-helix transcriptional regulator [Pseudomonadota bacterium]